MVVFKGKRPTDPRELSKMIRGVNDTFCFFEDLSKWQKAEYECSNLFQMIWYWLFK